MTAYRSFADQTRYYFSRPQESVPAAPVAGPANRLDMFLAPGEMQFVSNHTIVHARTAYTDDPAHPRHLLRLWLSLEE